MKGDWTGSSSAHTSDSNPAVQPVHVLKVGQNKTLCKVENCCDFTITRKAVSKKIRTYFPLHMYRKPLKLLKTYASASYIFLLYIQSSQQKQTAGKTLLVTVSNSTSKTMIYIGGAVGEEASSLIYSITGP